MSAAVTTPSDAAAPSDGKFVRDVYEIDSKALCTASPETGLVDPSETVLSTVSAAALMLACSAVLIVCTAPLVIGTLELCVAWSVVLTVSVAMGTEAPVVIAVRSSTENISALKK